MPHEKNMNKTKQKTQKKWNRFLLLKNENVMRTIYYIYLFWSSYLYFPQALTDVCMPYITWWEIGNCIGLVVPLKQTPVCYYIFHINTSRRARNLRRKSVIGKKKKRSFNFIDFKGFDWYSWTFELILPELSCWSLEVHTLPALQSPCIFMLDNSVCSQR